MSFTDWRHQFAVISWRLKEQKKYVSESKWRGHRASIKQMRWGLCLIYSEEKLKSRIKRPLKAIKLGALWRQAVSQEGALWEACLALFLVNLGITCRSIRGRTWSVRRIVGCSVLFAVCVEGPRCDLCFMSLLHSVKFFLIGVRCEVHGSRFISSFWLSPFRLGQFLVYRALHTHAFDDSRPLEWE